MTTQARPPIEATTRSPHWSAGPIGLVVSLLAVAGVAAIGRSWTTTSEGSWYDLLDKPAWIPPGPTFGIVWTLLYVMMAVAAWRVARVGVERPTVRLALTVYGVQLALNLGWTAAFFALQRPGWALVEIVVLLAAVVLTTVLFARLDAPAGWLMVPSVGWVAFATALTTAIVLSN